MDTRSKGAIPKKHDSAKKRVRRNLVDQLTPNSDGRSPQNVQPAPTPNFGGHSPQNVQPASTRPSSTTTLSSQSIPATRPLHGFPPNNEIQMQVDVQNEDIIVVGTAER